jgi:uncharacterized protein (TIGR03435 family)
MCKHSVISLLAASFVALGQTSPTGTKPAFEVASVKRSKSVQGRDGTVASDPLRLTIRNATLKRMILEAYQVPFSRILDGPAWIGSDEYDVDAKAEKPSGIDQLRLMLQSLLVDRFHLAIRRDSKERRVYTLTVPKGAQFRPGTAPVNAMGTLGFHGDMDQFADHLATLLTIPVSDDPTTPSRAQGQAVPVVNQTGVQGVYTFSVSMKTEPGTDPFTLWQRILKEQLGLKLEARRAPVEVLIVEHAERIPLSLSF